MTARRLAFMAWLVGVLAVVVLYTMALTAGSFSTALYGLGLGLVVLLATSVLRATAHTRTSAR